MNASVSEEGEFDQSFELFDTEAFRSLAMSVRLAYMNDESTNFGKVCNTLHQVGDEELRVAVAETRKAYNDFLNGKQYQFGLHGDFEGTTVGPREIFEIWLYGGTFHQDSTYKAKYREIEKFGAMFVYALHLLVAQVVHFILHLGRIVQHVLEQDPPATA